LTNLTQPPSLRPSLSVSTAPLRGSLKASLALLVLVLLALLLWQLFDQFQRTQYEQRQHSIDASAERVDQVNLHMALNAQMALGPLLVSQPFPSGREKAATLARLRQVLPAARSLLWLTSDGRILADTAGPTADEGFIQGMLQRAQGHPYFYSEDAGSDGMRLYLLIRQPGESTNGAWLLRLDTSLLGELIPTDSRDPRSHWRLESRLAPTQRPRPTTIPACSRYWLPRSPTATGNCTAFSMPSRRAPTCCRRW
jgi:hypothetical protein